MGYFFLANFLVFWTTRNNLRVRIFRRLMAFMCPGWILKSKFIRAFVIHIHIYSFLYSINVAIRSNLYDVLFKYVFLFLCNSSSLSIFFIFVLLNYKYDLFIFICIWLCCYSLFFIKEKHKNTCVPLYWVFQLIC